MPTLHVVITKEATFRGKAERWSNGYNFQTGNVAIDADMVYDVVQAVKNLEKTFTSRFVKFPYLLGGALGQDALYTDEVEGGGQLGQVDCQVPQLELCTLAQSKVAPKKYVMKYYHGAAPSAAAGDGVAQGAADAMEAQLLKLTDGTLPHGVVYCRPNGAVAPEPWKVDPFVRTHQLKRRGKRP